ncbi:MAG: DUF6629 family protein [Candidatus Babeliales bacterium]
MCFSAGSSFSAAAILGIVGLVSLTKSKNPHRMLAAIPLIFAAQQIIEGFLWLSFGNAATLNMYQPYFIYGFLFFAFMFWPIWVPLSLYTSEQKSDKKNLLKYCFFIGCATAVGLLIQLIKTGATATITHHHINYMIPMSQFFIITGSILYLIATVVPFFITSLKKAWIFGVVLALSYIVSFYAYYATLTSVWCFFAALLSILVLIIVR